MILKPALIVMTCFVFLLSACGQPVTTSNIVSQVNINEMSSLTNTEAEEIYVNNCGNSASSQQTSTRSQTVSLEGGADLGVSAEVVKASVEAKYVSTSGATKSQTVTAAQARRYFAAHLSDAFLLAYYTIFSTLKKP